MRGEQRLIIATCEKGTVEDVDDMKDIKAGLDKIRDQHPNFVDYASKEVFRPTNAKSVADPLPTRLGRWSKGAKERLALMENRSKLRIGIPRVLNIYTYAPLFNAYFESLGVQPENIVYSDYTSSDLYRAGASRGAIDPCFPAKIGISHVYNLIQEKHRKKPLDAIFFPMYDVLHSPLVKIVAAECLPHCHRHARNGESRVHQGERCLRRAQRQVHRPRAQFRRPQALRPSDAAGLAAHSRPFAGRERPRRRIRILRAESTTKPAFAVARARFSTNSNAKTALASSCSAAPIITIRA